MAVIFSACRVYPHNLCVIRSLPPLETAVIFYTVITSIIYEFRFVAAEQPWRPDHKPTEYKIWRRNYWRCHWPAAQGSPCLHSSHRRTFWRL